MSQIRTPLRARTSRPAPAEPVPPPPAACSPAEHAAEEIRARFVRLQEPRLGFGWKGVLWNLCGRIGHALFRREAPDIVHGSGMRLLHLGCGTKLLPGWVNADFYRLQQIMLRSAGRPEWMLDLTKDFHCPDDRFDGVFIEHVNEHLLYTQNFDMMREVFRVMRPGGTLRIVLPSLTRYLEWNRLREEQPKMARYGFLPEALSKLTQNHLHQSIWNEDLLRGMLLAIGFEDAATSDYGTSSLPVLAQETANHRWESLYLECRKPA